MMIKIVRFSTLVAAALALSLTSAHVLEMPQKMQYDAALYSAVNTTMYRYFAIVGGVYSIGAIALAAWLCWLVREDGTALRWTLAGTVLFVLWLVSWIALVVPVNGQVAAAIAADPSTVPGLWMRLRARWEYGHAVGFALELLGFAALVWSVLARRRDPLG
jgi:hypothetical protein